MPAVRPSSASRLALSLFMVSALSLPLAPFAPARVAACPVSPPVPLRMLFKQSRRVAVATAVESVSELTQLPAYDGGPKMITLKTTFHVSESLKGDPSETTLVVHEWGGYETHPAPSDYQKGERRLLFLVPNEGGGYVVADFRYGAKKLSDDDLKIYLQRIYELSAILQKEKPDEAEILEWLVRCAEEKATRWEGAYELASSMHMVADKAEAERQEEEQGGEESAEEATEEAASEEGASEEAASESAEAATETEAGEVAAEGEVEAETELTAEGAEGETVVREVWVGGYGTDIEAGAATRLTKEQKERLLSALFGAEEVGEGEQALIQLAKDSGDERLVPFLVKQLRRMDAEPTYDAHPMVMTLAHVLKDETLADLAEDYCTNAPYGEFVEEETEETEEAAGSEAAEESEGPEQSDSEKETEKRVPARLPREAPAPGKKVTGAQRRSEMLRAFLAAVDNKVQYDLAMQLSR